MNEKNSKKLQKACLQASGDFFSKKFAQQLAQCIPCCGLQFSTKCKSENKYENKSETCTMTFARAKFESQQKRYNKNLAPGQ